MRRPAATAAPRHRGILDALTELRAEPGMRAAVTPLWRAAYLLEHAVDQVHAAETNARIADAAGAGSEAALWRTVAESFRDAAAQRHQRLLATWASASDDGAESVTLVGSV